MPSALLSILNVLTSLSSVCMYLSPTVSMKHMIKAKATGDTQLIPLVCMFGNCHLW